MSKKTFQICTIVLSVLIIISAAFLVYRKLKPVSDDDSTGKESQEVVEETTEEQESEEEKTEEVEQVEFTDTEIMSQLQEALSYALGKDKEVDEAKAFALLAELAEYDNADIHYLLGEMYLQGRGTEKDSKKAAEYIQKAFEGGCDESYELYAKMCFLGVNEVIVQDYEKSAAIFAKMADDDAFAARMMGIMHTFGMGVPSNLNLADGYFAKAIELGDSEAEEWQNRAKTALISNAESDFTIDYSMIKTKEIDYAENDKLEEWIDEYETILASEEKYADFDSELTALANLSIPMATTVSIFGKNNWLFLQNPNDGSSYHDYVGDNAFTEEELATIASHLTEQKAKIEEAGAEFVLLIIPNKEIIYAEYMPTYIERVSEETRTDQLVKYLNEKTDINVVYLKNKYLELKNSYQLYYNTDTHYNMQGSFVALAEFINMRYNKEIGIEDTHFDIHMNNYCGDIAVMLGRADRYSRERVYFLPQTSVPQEDTVDESLMLIGDSFSEFLNTQAGYYFNGGVNHVMIMNHNYNFYQATDAMLSGEISDVVVWECVERYIERLK